MERALTWLNNHWWNSSIPTDIGEPVPELDQFIVALDQCRDHDPVDSLLWEREPIHDILCEM